MTQIKALMKIWWLWPAVAMIATYFIIMLFAAGQSIWFDEGYSITLAHRPVGELLALTAVDAHPPLYYLILKAWGDVFGWSEYALRSLSAIFASLTVGVVFLLVRKLFTVRTALVVLPFLIFAPFALRYGYEVRMYALAALIGVLATLVLVYAQKSRSTKLWIVYAVLVALGMYTLYMTAALWIGHVVWLLIVSRRKKAESFFKQKWVLALGGAVILFVPYLLTFVNQLLNSALPGIGNPVTLTRLGDIIGMTVAFTPEWKVNGVIALGLLATIVLTVYLLVFAYRKLPVKERSNLILLIILVVIPIAFFILTSLPKPIFVNRYMAHVVIFSYALIGVAVALGWRYGRQKIAGILGGVTLTMLIFGSLQLQQTGNFIYERLQYPRTSQMRSEVMCNDTVTVVADDPYTYIDSSYYFGDCDLRFFSKDEIANKGGYAPLRSSAARISQPIDIKARTLVHLRWDGATPSFTPDYRYKLTQSTTYDKQVVDRYELQSY